MVLRHGEQGGTNKRSSLPSTAVYDQYSNVGGKIESPTKHCGDRRKNQEPEGKQIVRRKSWCIYRPYNAEDQQHRATGFNVEHTREKEKRGGQRIAGEETHAEK